ncbi:MAG: hypothetical protein L6R38_001456 [Xanthoria sp. 2 TBL-2021]|nr:MAG: hypothetical protein L6R38_001456 [Xanthoria sp. 2 TBL-2021]
MVPVQQGRRTPLEQQSRVMRGYRFVMADERRRLNDAATGALDAFRTDLRVESSDLSAPDLPIEPSEVSVGDLPAVSPETPASDPPVEPSDKFYRDTLKKSLEASMSDQIVAADQPVEHLDTSICSLPINQSKTCLMDLPREILLIIFSSLSFLDLAAMASAFPKAREIIDFYDLIRVRELQCFCLKEHFQDSKLGVDVDIGYHGKEKKLSSEFDLLSHRAFYQHNIRKSIHGSFADASHFSVLSHFLNDIVVSFSEEAERSNPCSTLAHASEKAVESYFAIYHLLLCLAADNPSMFRKANNKVFHFLSGKTSKTTCPNLGHLLVATLISDRRLTENLSVAIIKEAILRNVVWMLDSKGRRHARAKLPRALSHQRISSQKDLRGISNILPPPNVLSPLLQNRPRSHSQQNPRTTARRALRYPRCSSPRRSSVHGARKPSDQIH